MTESREPQLNLDLPLHVAPLGDDDPPAGDEVVAAAPRPEEQVGTQEDPRAEFERSRRRERKEMDEHEVKVRGTILRDFLEVADNLERAIASWKECDKNDAQAVRDGVDMVLRLFRSKLARYSVTTIEAKGKPFDPHVHHAVSQAPSTEPPGTVLHEVEKGYRMDGRLLRPAIVVVASAPETASEANPSNEAPSTGGESTGEWGGYQRNRR